LALRAATFGRFALRPATFGRFAYRWRRFLPFPFLLILLPLLLQCVASVEVVVKTLEEVMYVAVVDEPPPLSAAAAHDDCARGGTRRAIGLQYYIFIH
jgi:hypothetical protein